MKIAAPLLALAALAFVATPGSASLKTGVKAPTFVAQGAKAGKPITVDLARALKKGPVVLYFFPAAFTPGCTAEAHAFAAAMPKFQAAGATVIGMTMGNVDQLAAFSTKECSSAFPVAAASAALRDKYDVVLKVDGKDKGVTDRTTYVIAPNGKIVLAYSDLNWNDHVAKSLAAVQALHHKR
jgi:peroxiredoxin